MKKQSLLKKISYFGVILISFTALSALGQSNSGITYHGRILKPNGTPLSGANVQFKVQIRSPGNENCLLYEEIQTKNLTSTNGAFSITINDMSGTRGDDHYAPGLRYTLDRVFQNRLPYSTAFSCETGSSYTPNTGDGRRLTVLFKDETMPTWEEAPSSLINFVPLALDSKTVGGFTPSHLLRVDDSVGAANATPFTSTQFTNLVALINGTSTLYTKQSSTTGATLPVVSSMPSGASAGSIWYDSTDGKLKYSNGTATAVTLESGAATLPNVGTAGTYTKVTTDAQGRVTTGTTLAESDIPQLTTANKVSGSAITTGNISTSGSFTTSSSVTATGAVSGSYFSGRAVHINEFTGTNTQYVQLRTPSAANGFTTGYVLSLPLNDGDPNELLMTDGSGNLSWTSSSGLGAWSVASGNAFRSTGNVGIGTANPLSKLDIGSASSTGTFAEKIGFSGTNAAAARVNYFDIAGLSTVDTVGIEEGGVELRAVGNGTMRVAARYDGRTVNSTNAWRFYTGGTERLTIDGQGRLGVGDNHPDFDLEVTNSLAVSSTANADGDRFLVNSLGKVGIGTTNPDAKFSVVDSAAVTTSATVAKITASTTTTSTTNAKKIGLDIQSTGTWTGTGATNTGLNVNVSGGQGGVYAATFTGGDVGIGTSTPGAKLEISETAAGALGPTLRLRNPGNSGAESANIDFAASTNTAGYENRSRISGYVEAGGQGRLDIYTKAGGASTFAATPDLSVKDAKVGIGITSPAAKLDVAGTIKISASAEDCTTGTDAGLIRYSGTSLQFCNGTGWQTLGISGAGLTSLGGLTGNAQTFAAGSSGTAPAISSSGTVHTLNVPLASGTGVTSGTISKTEYDAFNAKLGTATSFSGDVSGAYNATSVDKIKGVAVTITTPSAGQYLKYTAGGWVNAAIATSEVTGLTTALGDKVGYAAFPSTCTAGQTIIFTSPANTFTCLDISLPSSQITGQVAVANGGTGAATAAQNSVFAGPATGGTGAPSFRALVAGDLPSGTLVGSSVTTGYVPYVSATNTLSNSSLYYSGSNVGIGVTSPARLLHINGPMRMVASALPGTPATGDMAIDSNDSNKLKWYDGSGWQSAAGSAAGITSLGGLTGATQTFAAGSSGNAPAISSSGTVHTLNVPLASAGASVTSGTISNADYLKFDAKLGTTTTFAGDVTGTYDATSLDKIKGAALTITTPAAGQYLKYTAGGWVNSAIASSDVTGLTTALSDKVGYAAFPSTCTAGQTIVFTSPANTFTCLNISLPSSQITGQVAVANGGTGAATAAQNSVFAGPSSGGTGAPSFRALTAADLPSGTLTGVSGTAGRLPYFATATSLGDSPLHFDGTNLGIGTTTQTAFVTLKPAANKVALKIDGSVTANNGAYFGGAYDSAIMTNALSFDGGTYTAHALGTSMMNLTAGEVRFYTNYAATGPRAPSQRLTIDKDGNVGIGVTSPDRLLHVNGPMRLNAAALPGTPAAGDIAVDSGDGNKLKWHNGSGWQTISTSTATGDIVNGGNTGAVTIGTNDGTALTLETNNSPKMTILSTGLVGIGTASPTNNLAVSVAASSDATFSMADADVTHGVTTIAPTNQFFLVSEASSAAGGALVNGFSDNPNSIGLNLIGNIGASPTATIPAVSLTGYKANGTGRSALAGTETVFGVFNGGASSPNLVMLGNGNVGVGVATPLSPLHVNGTIRADNICDETGANCKDISTGWASGLGTAADGAALTPSITFTNDTDTGFYLGGANVLGVATGGTAKWYINDKIESNTTYGARVTSGSSASSPTYTFKDDTGTGMFRAGTGEIGFTTSGVEKIRVNNDGLVGFGTSNPEEVLHINTAIPDSGILIRGGFAGNDSVNLNFQRSRGTNAAPTTLQAGDEIFNILAQGYGSSGYGWTSGIMSFVDGTPSGGNVPASLEFWTNTGSGWGQRMKLAASGNLGINNSNPTYRLDVNGTARVYGLTDASDVRLKNTIVPLRDDYVKVLNLQGVSYYWNDTTNHEDDKQIGLIAQEVEKEYPELVETDKDGMKSVNYSHLVAPIIEAFKTLVSKFEGLSVRVDGQSREIASVKEENKKLVETSTKLLEANKKLSDENEAIKRYLCAKDPEASICQ